MKITNIKTEDLKKSKANVRAGHSKEDIKTMAASIKQRGVISPPTVRKNGDGRYEILAGQLRVAGAIAAGLEEVPCVVTTAGESDAIGISLTENAVRREMSSIEKFKAFYKLYKSGESIEDIAVGYGITPNRVQQVLAIGGMPKKILDAAEAGEIQDRELETLACAPISEQRRWAKLPKNQRPGWRIKEWLGNGDKSYRASVAIFDLDDYKGGKLTDMFSNDSEEYLIDGDQFLELQHAAASRKLEDWQTKGWKCTKVDYWQHWLYKKTKKADGGKIFWTFNETSGAYEFHVGYERIGKSPAPSSKGDGTASEKPAVSKAFLDYCHDQKTNQVKQHMVSNPKNGLIASIVLLLKQCDNISMPFKGYLSRSDAYCNSINEQENNLDIRDAIHNAMTEMGVEQAATYAVDIKDLVAYLEQQTPKTLQRYLVAIVANQWDATYASDTSPTSELGQAFDLQFAQIDYEDGFWNGITNKQTLLDIAKENDIEVSEKATVKALRQTVRDNVKDDWIPEWLLF